MSGSKVSGTNKTVGKGRKEEEVGRGRKKESKLLK